MVVGVSAVVVLVLVQLEVRRNDPAVGFGHWCKGLLLEGVIQRSTVISSE